jgi:hypothetical protein
MEPAAIERVCPHCAGISRTSGRRCPYCGRGFRRRLLPGIAALMLVFAVGILGGVGAMLVYAGQRVDDQLNRKVRSVQDDFSREIGGVQRDIRRELDQRLPAAPSTPAP